MPAFGARPGRKHSTFTLVLSFGIVVGSVAGAIRAGWIVATQQYLHHGMFRIAADVLRSELNIGVLCSLAATITAAGAWLLVTRWSKGSRRWVFGIICASMLAVFVGYVLKGTIRDQVMALNGADGAGALTVDYVLGRLAQYRPLVLMMPVAFCLAAVAFSFLFPVFSRLADKLGPGLATVRTLGPPTLVALVAFNAVVAFVDIRNPPAGPNVILISIDTLRADRLGSYGNARGLSPNLDALARDAAVLENCFAQATFTLTSHISMLTSLYPHAHRVHGERALDLGTITLAEALKNEGYRTLGVVRAVTWMDARYGFSQGFDEYFVRSFNDDAAVQNAFLAGQLAEARGEKLFLFLHYFDVHSDSGRLPYESPESFRSRLCGSYREDPLGETDGRGASEYLAYVNHQGITLPSEITEHISCLYDTGVAYMDHRLSELFELLALNGLLDTSLLIITSDHGEEFQEHGYMFHSNPFDHRELVHVPLIVKEPRENRGTAKITELVEIIDLMPTILDYVGASHPPVMQGRSFAPLLVGQRRGEWKGRHSLSEARGSIALTTDRWRLLRHENADGTEYKLFDRLEDPGETRNVLELHPEIAADLMAEMTVLSSESSTSSEGRSLELSTETKERLKALGYVE